MTSALLIVGHGTRDPAGQAECDELVSLVREARPGLRVALGYLELCPPPITETIEELVVEGVTDVTVVPLVLLAAGHAKGDVPAAVVRARLQYPEVTFRYAAPLGIHPDVLAVTDDRLEEAVSAPARDRTAVVVIGRGTSDPDANGDLAKIARLLWEGRPWPLVEAGFVSLAEPSVRVVLDRVRRLGAERVVVHPYFLFTGVLERRIREQADAWAAAHPDVEVVHAGQLGPHERLAALLLQRFDEARAGDVRANCDACVYRVALPGFEDRVGEPQTLHYHPDDDETHGHGHAHGHSHAHSSA
jgi:sirohydrochlorin cobaltochelatase